ncbi:hypothetical protein IP69_13895 [Bosea sp. AAP35]|uniref:hypothetical protein n=1 Tax=Bosea sp. AAP35 TaxID=1523417 RepID=UPI0006B9A4ED|nr:hypothetical protein [Bosea sp. AAP35]KPF67091.1 hypothetical protein IP69_13895 [Bosea sp. AAP35]
MQGDIVASGAWVPNLRSAGLERVARSAGEAFGHEDMPVLPRWRWTRLHTMRYPAMMCGVAMVTVVSILALA